MTRACKVRSTAVVAVALGIALPALHTVPVLVPAAIAGGVGIPTNEFGIGLGNLRRFDGLRMNLRDRNVERVRGINLTLWFATENKDAEYRGFSAGLAPSGGRLSGVNVGLAGAGAQRDLNGLTFGVLGAGSGYDVTGVAIGGLGVGAGRSARGLMIGGLGCGAGQSVTGVGLGGLGCGAGEDVVGLVIGGLGCGAGRDVKGIVLGGLGAGAGRDFKGIGLGGAGCGAGRDLSGIVLGGLGCGAGRNLDGVAIGGLGAGAGERARGLLAGGFRVEAEHAEGVFLGSHIRIRPNGSLTGFAGGLFNQVRGEQVGVSIALVNYARRLRGLQIGAVNWVSGNPGWRRVLPVVNW